MMSKGNESTTFDSVNNKVTEHSETTKFSGTPQKTEAPSVEEKDRLSSLRPRHPDAVQGYQPLSNYLVKKYVGSIMRILHMVCDDRGRGLDYNYWEKITTMLFSAPDTQKSKIVPSKAGYGKSTWILALLIFFRELEVKSPTEATALGGVCVVLQKVETLNELADSLDEYSRKMGIETGSGMIALQGWTPSGQERGYCQNTDVASFRDCQREKCPFASQCRLLGFAEQARNASLLGITQARFNFIRNDGNLNFILLRQLDDGIVCHRRFLLFDEKFQMAQVHTLSRRTLDAATIEMEALIPRKSASETSIQYLENGLDYTVKKPFQYLRSKLTRVVLEYDAGIYVYPEKAGFCSATDASNCCTDISIFEKYTNFKNAAINLNRKYSTQSLTECFHVWDALINERNLLYTLDSGFAIHSIGNADLQFGECLAVVFDATAEIDSDYFGLKQVDFLHAPVKKPPERIRFHIYTDDAFRVSKSAFNSLWKIPLICNEISTIMKSCKGEIYISTYQKFASAIYSGLQKILSSEDISRIATVKGSDGHKSLPYYGGTNGSNNFSQCRTVVLIGYPRLDPATYIRNTCAVFGTEAIRQELADAKAQKPLYQGETRIDELPSVRKYVCGHLAARLEQEIFRSMIREYDFRGKVNVYLFKPPEDVFDELQKRFPKAEIKIVHDKPDNIDALKRSTRSYQKKSTSFGRLDTFIQNWDGAPILVSDIKARLEISNSVWHDITQSGEWKDRMRNYRIVVSGNGPHRKWSKIQDESVA